jgi:hypothetical protein
VPATRTDWAGAAKALFTSQDQTRHHASEPSLYSLYVSMVISAMISLSRLINRGEKVTLS